MKLVTIMRVIRYYKNCLIVVLSPIILLPIILIHHQQEALCGYVMLLMSIYWITECLPLAGTALMPIYMFPLFGILSVDQVAKLYMKSLTLRIIGAIGISVAIEESKAHVRLALKVLLTVGSSPPRLMLGIMLISWFCATWTSKSATAVMMLTVAYALIDELKEIKKKTGFLKDDGDKEMLNKLVVNVDDNTDTELKCIPGIDTEHNCIDNCDIDDDNIEHNSTEEQLDDNESDDTIDKLNKAFSLCIIYGASVGGVTTLISLSSHVIVIGYLDRMYEDIGEENPVTFLKWSMFGVPTSLTTLFAGWLWLQLYFFKFKYFKWTSLKSAINGFAEVTSTLSLVLVIILWITLDLKDIGWGDYFKPKYVKDSVPVIFILSVLFICPSEIPSLQAIRSGTLSSISKPLLTWDAFKTKIPWGLIFLVGGGFSMSEAAEESGLSVMIATQLEPILHLPYWLLNLILLVFVACVTEFMSISSTVALLLPIISEMSIKLGCKPWYLMFSSNLAVSFTFTLPTATVSTALVFSFGRIKMKDMVRAGLVMNVIAITTLFINTQWLGRLLFGEIY